MPSDSRLFGTLSTEQVAASIVRAVERGRGDVATPRRLAAVLALHHVVPGTVEWLVAQTGWTRAQGGVVNPTPGSALSGTMTGA